MPLTPKSNTRVQLTFGRELTEEDIKALQTKTDALEALVVSAQAGHHHDHDSVLGTGGHHVGDPVFEE
jgi:hypothetical protein